jgi:excisionase family DNA binding protein
MDGFVVVERTAVDGGLPNDLPSNIAGREELEQALRNAGLAIVAVQRVEEANVPSRGATRSDGKSRLRAELEALVNEADESELARLEAAATASPDDGLDERFWGPAPDSVTAAEAVVADLTDQFAQRRELAANSFGRQEAAKLLSISPQSVTDKLESRKLVGIKVGREWRLPRWQFDPDNVTGALPDLDVLQAAFPGGPVSLSRWVMRPNPEFDGRTPRDEAVAHGSASVIKVARALTSAGW